MELRVFDRALTRAVASGLIAAALVDRDGNTVGLAGDLAEDAAMPLAAFVMYRCKSDDLSERLFTGEILSLAVNDRVIAVGVVKRQLFVVAVLLVSTPALLEVVRQLCDDVEGTLRDAGGEEVPLPWNRGGGSGSGPAELPVIELGITVGRARGKA